MRTLSEDAKASIPGQLRLTRKAYARYLARSPKEERALFRGTFVPYGLRRLFGFDRAERPHWLEFKEHFAHGCLCPAQIVDLPAGLVATFTNLTMRGTTPCPVVKVRHEPLHLLPDRLLHEGTRLTAVSVYLGNAASWEAGHWLDFNPLPVECLIEDENVCATARSRLSASAWEALTIARKMLGNRPKVGLHRVAVGMKSSGVRSEFQPARLFFTHHRIN